MVFAACTLYYTHAYIAEAPVKSGNKRAEWYRDNRSFVRASQVMLTCIVAACILILLFRSGSHIIQATVWQWLATAIFPVTGALYYGSVAPGKSTHNLRNNGWLKPFVIGFVWAGTVTVYPVLFKSIESGEPYNPGIFNLLLFIKNLMYITMLCIMFDFKDYAADHNQQLKTFVVRIGLRRTLFFIIIPLTIIGLGTFLSFAVFSRFPAGRIAVNTIPFILLIFVTLSMQRRKSILYYLAIIDGLMLVKALCGIAGMLLW
ncbi:hypothetical protein [Sediminibacterium ginsengisoli]|uniref:UbiA prenyltransferase family protein n=1 Tax=Sediminibacterium ginsengisoli TaxID=413434 RepID=A0A1T4QGV7_9BACT|nr:hypothetical protein [Sediminibacterium ginsengisoli]SKA03040.1 hypothetical protein SAMN04488132_108129 [Sediminibacterium ginsengisoli]